MDYKVLFEVGGKKGLYLILRAVLWRKIVSEENLVNLIRFSHRPLSKNLHQRGFTVGRD